jgi:tetratricopeptide (TPR) repeat protein
MKKTSLFLLVLLPGLAFGQTQNYSSALPPDAIELMAEANAALYNIDYATARAKYEELRKRLPHHPAGDLYLAQVTWLEHLYKSRRLQTGLYRDQSSFYAGADKAKEEAEGDAVDPAVDRTFRGLMTQAKIKALALVARDKNDPDALYFLGAVYGVMAGYEASTARKFFAALRNGSRSVDAHQKVLKLKPDYYNAYLTVGMYDYIMGSLPFAYKAIAAMAGHRGSKERGIGRLQTIIEKDAMSANGARVLLLAIYQNEKRYQDALDILDYLAGMYPRNYLVKLEKASTLVSLKRTQDAYRAFEELLQEPAAGQVADLIHYQFAEALVLNHEYKRAAEHFQAVPKCSGAETNLATLALLRSAQVYDLAGLRPEAVAQYKVVLTRPNIYDSREQTQRGLKEPFSVKERENGRD